MQLFLSNTEEHNSCWIGLLIYIIIQPALFAFIMDRGDKESKGNDDGAKGGEENRQGRRPRRERQEETASTKQNDEMYAQNQEQMNANGKPRRRRGAAEEEEEAADGKSGWMGSVQGPDDDEDAVK